MAEARASARHIRRSPYKVRQVLNLIRGEDIATARDRLALSDRGASADVLKVLNSAVHNAEHELSLGADDLFVEACYADEGPTLKRWRPRARGRATRIRKRTCHITVVLGRLPDELVAQRDTAGAASADARRQRRRRVEGSRGTQGAAESTEPKAPVADAADADEDALATAATESEASATPAAADAEPTQAETSTSDNDGGATGTEADAAEETPEQDGENE
ncbi:MAG: 50S ribosomal protein L22 [Actinobacteria bacterium]|nr:50S ribosomal protein L22 [Actinomycetota bacterium]MCB9389862.1 50S ribosomal protein L22 [Acidimicrobiia bacterium]